MLQLCRRMLLKYRVAHAVIILFQELPVMLLLCYLKLILMGNSQFNLSLRMQHHSTLFLEQTGRQMRSELSLFVTEISSLLRIVYCKYFSVNPLLRCLFDIFVARYLVADVTLTDSSYSVLFQSGCTDLWCLPVGLQLGQNITDLYENYLFKLV